MHRRERTRRSSLSCPRGGPIRGGNSGRDGAALRCLVKRVDPPGTLLKFGAWRSMRLAVLLRDDDFAHWF